MPEIHVLLVDDETEFVATLAERLQLRGYAASFAVSGADALRRLETDRFDIVVLDVKMPGLDGLAVLEHIRRFDADLPVLLLTGHGDWKDKDRGVQMGATDCLMKPVDIDELIEKLQQTIRTDD